MWRIFEKFAGICFKIQEIRSKRADDISNISSINSNFSFKIADTGFLKVGGSMLLDMMVYPISACFIKAFKLESSVSKHDETRSLS